MPNWTPSPYQESIYAFTRQGQGNASVRAVAGSGKSSTMVEATRFVPPSASILFLAFNRLIVDHLRSQMPPNGQALTTHSLALRCIKAQHHFISVVDSSTEVPVQDILATLSGVPRRERNLVANMAGKLISLVKATLVDYNSEQALRQLVEYYSLDLGEWENLILALVPMAMKRGEENTNQLDFDDMLYWMARDEAIPVPSYDFIFVDESQDMSAAQIQLLLRLAGKGGRIIAVGDQSQSLYGFRGADINAIPRLEAALHTTQLPLSITYRCPLSHVALAQQLVPEIQAWEMAKEGQVLHLSKAAMYQQRVLKPGTLVMCRVNAPLVHMAYTLMGQGVPVLVRGRDIGQGVTALIRKLHQGEGIGQFLVKLQGYYRTEMGKLLEREAPASKVRLLQDKYDTILALSEGCGTVEQLLGTVSALFTDREDKDCVTFSSIHRAKGLEADVTVIIEPQLLPLETKTAWEAQQEANCEYVALTRSKDTLIFEEKE